jgi:HK97 family phage major capsid protein
MAPNGDLRGKLTAVESELADLRARRAVKAREAEEARKAFAGSSQLTTSNPAFKAAEQKTNAVRAIDERIADAQSVQTGVLRMLGDGQAGRSKFAAEGADLRTPGAWLSRIATKATMTTDVGATTDLGGPFIDRLTTASALLASGPTVVDIDTSSIRLPKLAAEMAPADVVPELEPIPERSPDLLSIEVTPPKIAVLDVVSEEAWKDTRPAVLAAHEREQVRSVAAGFEDLSWNAAGADPGGPGILHTSGVVAVSAGGTLADLDVFAEAIAGLVAAGAEPSAIYLNPTTWGRLGQLKKSADSNEPLVSAALSATGRPARALLGVPVFLSGAMPPAQAVVAQASEIVVVRRSDLQVDVDEHFKFSQAGVGVRVIFRAQTFLAAPAGVAVITNLPTT